MKRRKDAQKAREIARERIDRLFDLAEREHAHHPERSDRYVDIAKRISTRTRTRLPRRLKGRVCKSCSRYLAPSGTRTRVTDGVVTTTCLGCGGLTRHPYRPRSRTGPERQA